MPIKPEEFKRLSEKDKVEYLKKTKAIKGREDFFYLCEEVLGYRDREVEGKFEPGVKRHVHGKMIELVTDKKRRKLLLLPRGSYKTSVVTIGGSIHKILNNPNIRILIDSEVLDNAQRFVGQIKTHFQSDEFRSLYGDLISNDHRETAREFTISTRTDKNLKEPTVYATGIGTVNVGMHYDAIIVDDPHSEKNVSTKEQIDKVIAHYRLLLSLLEPGGELIIIGTRWHFYDLYSYILEEENQGQWEIYIEKAIREDGSLFFPERLTKSFLKEQRDAQGAYVFSCQYLNEPVSAELQTFRREDFRYWGEEGDPYPVSNGKRVLLNLYILVDRAFSTRESADYTGIVVAGVSSSGNIYVLEAERKRCGLQALTDRVWQFMDKYGASRVKSVNVETINYEEIEAFFREQMGKKNKFFILQRLSPDSRMSKNGRIETALQARYANHVVYHRKRMMDLEDELLRFPVATHDDIIDALAYLPQVMTQPGDPKYENDAYEYQPAGWFGKTGY